MKVTNLATLKTASSSLDADLRAVLAKYGITMKSRRGRISDSSGELTLKLECIVAASGGADAAADDAAEKRAFMAHARSYGLTEADYKQKFRTFDGKVYQLVGFNPSKPKNALSFRCVRTGKTFIGPLGLYQMATKVAQVG